MEKLVVNIVKYYYWFLVAIAASLMLGMRDVSSALIPIVIIAAAISCSSIRWAKKDGLVFALLLYSLGSYFFVEYAYSMRLYYLGIRSQIVPMLLNLITLCRTRNRGTRSKYGAAWLCHARPLFFFVRFPMADEQAEQRKERSYV